MHFDDVFGLVGEMGVFQWGIFIVLLFAAAWGVESIYMVFVGKSQNTYLLFYQEINIDQIQKCFFKFKTLVL